VNARVDSNVHMMLTAALPCSRPRIRRSVVFLKKFGETPWADFTQYSVLRRTRRWVSIASMLTPSWAERIMHWDGIMRLKAAV
jgi:hypothetical protein